MSIFMHLLYNKVMLENVLLDQFHIRDGWHYTEDISFHKQVNMTMTLNQGDTQTVPITFAQPPLRSFNQIPAATASFLVLRHLDLASERPAEHRDDQWQWVSDSDSTFTALASSPNTVTLTFLAGPAPSGVASGQTVQLALRKIQLGTLPAGVTITKIQVRPHWAPIGTNPPYDDLHLASPISGSIDLGAWYDNQYGLINGLTQIGLQTQIDVQISYTNANGTNTNVPFQMYGTQKGQQWAQWLVQFQPSYGGGAYDIGQYDDVDTPARTFVLDKLIPVQINDTGIVHLGDLIFTSNQQISYYANFTAYDIMLTATVAYLTPIGY